MTPFRHVYRRMIDAPPSNVLGWTFFVLLWPWALLYRMATGVRAASYRFGLRRVYRAAVPVISVGNLTVGGTGKTPVVDELVKRLGARGHRVAVVSRGYGGTVRTGVGVVATGDGRLRLDPRDAGDEPCLLALRNPALQVYVARRRACGVRAAEQGGAEIIILDDGFQHRAVHRDVDIVLLDGRAPFGNGQLLPAGPLREPPGALGRADLVIVTHAGASPPVLPFGGPTLACRHRLADVLMTLAGQPVPWTELDGRELLALAGIARPEDFFAALRARGVPLAATVALNDHQDYSTELLNQLGQSCDNKKLWITTEKDAVKLRTAALPCPCLVAPLVLDVVESDRLDDFLTHWLERVK